MPPEVTAEEWANMAQAAARPGIHYHAQGFRERLGFATASLKDKKILGRPLYEVVTDFAAGFAVKSAVRSGIMLAGTSALGAVGAAVLAGAASGAVFAGGKEWFRQARENWQEPLPPEAVTTKQQILERLNDLTPNDWNRLGGVTLRGAMVGAAFGLVGAVASEVFHAASAATTSGDSAGSAPVNDSLSASPDAAQITVSDPTIAPMPETSIPAEPVADMHIPTPEPDVVVPDQPNTSMPQDGISSSPSTDIPSAQPGQGPIPQVDSSARPDIPPVPPTETLPDSSVNAPIIASPEAGNIPSVPDSSSTIPSSDTAPSQSNIPIAHGESSNFPVSVPTPEPDVVVPDQPNTSMPQDGISSSPSTDIPSAPADSGAVPVLAESSPISSIDAISENVSNLKDVSLVAGSNPWQVATEILKQVDPDHVPSNQEIFQVTQVICEQNDISVPEWGISGSVDEHQIPVGYLLRIDPEVKSVITDIVKGGK